jgi:hypothetical protein
MEHGKKKIHAGNIRDTVRSDVSEKRMREYKRKKGLLNWKESRKRMH